MNQHQWVTWSECRYHPYTLRYNKMFGTVGDSFVRKGALLRFVFGDGEVGFSDCHPWPELGDAPLQIQLNYLKQRKTSHLLERSAHFAFLDARARTDHLPLYDSRHVPLSHKLIIPSDNLEPFIQEGFTHFKMKAGTNWKQETVAINIWATKFPQIQLRLDFNERISRKEFHLYWEAIDNRNSETFDFVEDPYPYDPIGWQEDQESMGVRFAADKEAKRALQEACHPLIVILKPSVQQVPISFPPSTRFVVTSYLDHPIGQCCAAYSASILQKKIPDQLDICGLLSHSCYQRNLFSDHLSSKGPEWIAPPGSGWGFDDLLHGLEWKTLP